MKKKPTGTMSIQDRGGIPVILIGGYFEEGLGDAISQAVDELLRQGKVQMVLDFSPCIAVNSPGIEKLQTLTLKVVEDFQGRLVLAQVKPFLIRVFELAAIIPYAETASDVSEGLALLGGTP